MSTEKAQNPPISVGAVISAGFIIATGALLMVIAQGWRPNPALLLAGTLGVGGLVLVIAALASVFRNTTKGDSQVSPLLDAVSQPDSVPDGTGDN